MSELTFELGANGSGTQGIPMAEILAGAPHSAYGVSINVQSQTGSFSVALEGSFDGSNWSELYASGSVASLRNVVENLESYTLARVKVTDTSGASNTVVVVVRPFQVHPGAWSGLENHIHFFTGDIWYVDAGVGASGDGTTPNKAFLTIGEGITAAQDGMQLRLKPETMTKMDWRSVTTRSNFGLRLVRS